MEITGFDVESIIPFFIFAIPIVAIAGGITAGIVKTLGQQRLMELAQRERIAAIERGIDPAKLPPPMASFGDELGYLAPYEYARRRSQGLMIGGVVTLSVGVSVGIFLGLMSDERYVWTVALIPASVGVALLLSAWIVRPRPEDRPSAPIARQG